MLNSDKPNIDKVLGTKDKERQAEIFLQVANAPVIDIMIRFDGRTGGLDVAVVGGKLDLEQFNRIVDAVKEQLRKQELEAVIGQARQAEPIQDGEDVPAD